MNISDYTYTEYFMDVIDDCRDQVRLDLIEQYQSHILEICQKCYCLEIDESEIGCSVTGKELPDSQSMCPKLQSYPVMCRSCESVLYCDKSESEIRQCVLQQDKEQEELTMFKQENQNEPFLFPNGNNSYISVDPDIVEKIKAEYLNEKFLTPPNYTMHRVSNKGLRYYIKEDNATGDIDYAASVTTIESKQAPMPKPLLEWYCNNFNSYDDAQEEVEKRALYGTFIHIVFKDMLLNKPMLLSSQSLKTAIQKFITDNRYNERDIDINEWIQDAKEDITGFALWLKEYEVIPMAIEVPLFYDARDGKWGGAIDLVAKITIKEGKKRKRILAIIDFKSGRKNFYASHAVQLYAYMRMWNQNFPKMRVRRVFNYGCNSFKMMTLKKYIDGGKAGNFKPYRFKEQTKNEKKHLWKLYTKAFSMDKENSLLNNIITFNDIEITRDTDFSNLLNQNIQLVYLNEKKKKRRLSHDLR